MWAFLLLLSAAAVRAFGPVGYKCVSCPAANPNPTPIAHRLARTPHHHSCDPTTCTIGQCQCASLANPGGLQPSEIPQFVLVTHDDAVSDLANFVVRSAIDGFKNPNGCNVPATWFTTSTGTNCDLVKKLYDENHEIALHTVSHAQLDAGLPGMEAEIMGARDDLMQCGIPKEKLLGFRAPYLVHNPEVRKILHKHGMLYDSSIIDFISSQSPTTKSFAQRLWPYSFNNGIAQDCTYTPAGQCEVTEKYPGMWEVPLWPLLHGPVDTDNNAYSMDPGPGFGGDVLTTLKTNFDQAYAGNRAPFPLFLHSPWFTDENVKATRDFITYALGKGDVFFVTVQEMLQWMANPVSAAEYKANAKCKPVNVLPPVKKSCQVYVAQPGDFFASIAGKFGVIDMVEMNKINPSLQTGNISPGVRLNIPPWDASCPPPSEIEPVTGPAMGDAVTVAVQGTGAGAAAGAGAGTQGAATTPEGTTSANVEMPAATEPVTAQAGALCQTWTVADGEFLMGISKATGASPQDIVSMNKLSSTPTGAIILTIGQQLKIPPYPECCEVNGCMAADKLVGVTPTRVDVNFQLSGTAGVDAAMLEKIKALVGGELDLPIGALTANVLTRRRGRRLRQATSVPTNVVVSIATTTPVRLAQKVAQELNSGDLEALLGGLGYSMNGMPAVKAYQNGKEVALADPNANAANGQSSSSGLSTGAIIGIAVGGGVALIALIGLVVFFVMRRRRVSESAVGPVSKSTGAGGMTVTASLRDAHRKSAKDPVAVVIGGYDTPRSGQTPRSRGSNRRFEDVLATHNPTFARTSTTTTAPTAPTVTPTTNPTTNPYDI